MDTNRIREIHKGTAYPESRSVYQALLQVWNECEQEKQMNKGKLIDADKLIDRLDEIFNDEVSITYIKNLIDELSEEKECCTCVNSISLNNGEKDICFDCRKDCNETSFAIKLANGINELHNTITKLETDNAALSKELTEMKLKLKDLSK